MGVESMKFLKNIKGELSHKKALAYFIGLLYPVTIAGSLYAALKQRTSSDFHVKHRAKINIMEKSEKIQQNRRKIIDEVMNSYNGKPNRETELIYAANATFENPVAYMRGKKSIIAMIHGLPMLMRELKIDSSEIEHYEDAIVIKHNATIQMGIWFRKTIPHTQYLQLNDENNKIEKHLDMWNHKPLFHLKGMVMTTKYINGNFIGRVIFGLPSGRFIE
eukprot:267421_1